MGRRRQVGQGSSRADRRRASRGVHVGQRTRKTGRRSQVSTAPARQAGGTPAGRDAREAQGIRRTDRYPASLQGGKAPAGRVATREARSATAGQENARRPGKAPGAGRHTAGRVPPQDGEIRRPQDRQGIRRADRQHASHPGGSPSREREVPPQDGERRARRPPGSRKTGRAPAGRASFPQVGGFRHSNTISRLRAQARPEVQ